MCGASVQGIRCAAALAILTALLPACAEDGRSTEPPAQTEARLFLELGLGGAVYQQDSTSWVVVEGWEIPWRVRRNTTEGVAEGQVIAEAGSASEGSDFGPLTGSQFRLSEGQWLQFLEWGCYPACPVIDDSIPEPDEQFSLRVESLTPGVGVDPVRSSVTVTILDDDGLNRESSSFSWPLDPAWSWTYRAVTTIRYPRSCSSASVCTETQDEFSYGGRRFVRLGPSGGLSISMDGPRAWVIPPGARAYPPDPTDSLTARVWESYPRLMFDASRPESPCESGFQGERRPFSCYLWFWSDRMRCRGLTGVATPAGVFRPVLRVDYEVEWKACGLSWPGEAHGDSCAYFIADSIGIVATRSRNSFAFGGYGAGSSSSVCVLEAVSGARR